MIFNCNKTKIQLLKNVKVREGPEKKLINFMDFFFKISSLILFLHILINSNKIETKIKFSNLQENLLKYILLLMTQSKIKEFKIYV